MVFRKLVKSIWPYLVILSLSSIFYFHGLEKVPVHLNQDELEFSLNAYSISKTLHDQSGRFLPFYFWHLDAFWATPVVVYLTAIFLRFFPISEATIRLPSVFIGLGTIFLVMVLVEQIFKNKILALIAGLIAATTPALFIHSRILLDSLYTVPFVLLWLIFLKAFLDKRTIGYLFVSGLSLGIGIHAYHAGKIMMPVYFLVTLVLLLSATKKARMGLFLYIAGFLIPILLFLPWLKAHPDTIFNQVRYIGSIDKSISPEKGIWGVINFSRTAQFLSSYTSYLQPDILFFTGDRSLIHSTRKVGAFLFPIVFLLVFGILSILFKKRDKFSKLLVFGFLTYPLAPSLVNDPQRIARGLVAIPFVILLSTYGVEYLLRFKEKSLKVFLVAIILLSLFQFYSFTWDYFGKYRERSYSVFNFNIGGAFESAIKSFEIRPVERLYIDQYIPFADRYLRFYELKLDKSVSANMHFFDFRNQDFSKFEKGSLVVLQAGHAASRADRIGPFEKIEVIREPDGNESFYIYFRD